jgi:DNA-directed RNA polymerase subunit RPC12/RpoP
MFSDLPEAEHHIMEFVASHANGMDELYCPTCGRRILLMWPPNYKKTVLDPGDEFAIHSGGKGGIVMGETQISQDEDEAHKSPEETYLAPWKDWMEQVDFESFWH